MSSKGTTEIYFGRLSSSRRLVSQLMHQVLLNPAYPVVFPGRTSHLYVDRILTGSTRVLNTAKSGLHVHLFSIGYA
jgi:hypothetical protein